MNEKIQTTDQDKKSENDQKPKTNDQCGLYFSSSLKIVDLDSGKVILNTRCD